MTMPTPAAALATFLGTSPWTYGTNLFSGPMREYSTGCPQVAAFVLETGGAAPVPMGGKATSTRTIGIDIVVRGERDKFDDNRARARVLWERCHRATIAGYTMVLCTTADPIPLGTDASGAALHLINVAMSTEA